MSTEEAIAHGIKSTAGVVTSAAVVMACVSRLRDALDADLQAVRVGLLRPIRIDATNVGAVPAGDDEAARSTGAGTRPGGSSGRCTSSTAARSSGSELPDGATPSGRSRARRGGQGGGAGAWGDGVARRHPLAKQAASMLMILRRR